MHPNLRPGKRQRMYGMCNYRAPVAGNSWSDFELAVHLCELQLGHYGPHLCYVCECAFNDNGHIWVQGKLPFKES